MGKLIDADALIKALNLAEWFNVADFNEAVCTVRKAQPVDAVEVRRGRWIKKRYWSEGVGMGESYGYWYACSECNHEVKSGYGGCSDRFCNNCGADMRKDGDGNG